MKLERARRQRWRRVWWLVGLTLVALVVVSWLLAAVNQPRVLYPYLQTTATFITED
jgi:4-amino-4-deoxy-L-arabinose transferase-like glycosyltransferase